MRFDNVTAAVASNARRRPDHPALIGRDGVVTHGELERRVRQAAGALRGLGLRAGDLVGLSMQDTVDHIVILFAMMRIGAVIVPMDARWTAAEKARVVEVFGPRTLLSDAADDAIPGVTAIRIDAAWMRAAEDAAPVAGWDTTEESPLLLSLSSGTTGIPKGPMVDHGLFMRRMFYETVVAGANPADVNMLATPIYFGGGRNITLQNILLGATVVLFPPPYDVEELVEAVNRHRVTSVFLVPTMLRRLLRLAPQDGLLFPHLRLLMCSGAMLQADELCEVRRRINPNLQNTYATTDGGIAAALAPADAERRPGSVGRPAYLTEMQIVDEQHRPLPPQEVGRIRYQTLAAADSYYRNPEETAAAYRDGWFYPGDLGYFDEEGFLYVVGRAKDIIIRGGVNIYPPEIEAVLGAHPAVDDVAVVGWPIGDMGEEIAAFVMPKGAADEQELIEHCRAQLARYKIPRRVFFVRSMPRNDAGKVNKARLAELLPATRDGALRERGGAA